MKKIILVFTLAIAAASAFAAVNENASTIFSALDMGAGARAIGMGGAYTAVADDASAVYWNAAGLGFINTPQAALTYDKWFMDTMYSQGMFACPLYTGVIGANIMYMNMGSITGRDTSGAATQNLNSYILGGSLGYGLSYGLFSAGAAVKIISQSMDNLTNSAFAVDAGGMYRAGMFSAGLSLHNLGTGNGYSLPTNIKAGVAIKPVDSDRNGLLFALDTQYLFKDALSVNAGAEYVYARTLAVRAGYGIGFAQSDLEGIKGLSGGIGVKVSGFSFDYAIATYGDLGITHMVTLAYCFGGPAALKRPEIAGESAPLNAREKAAVKAPVKAQKIKAAKAKQSALPAPTATPKIIPAATPTTAAAKGRGK
jgi:hypothetical protein